MGNFCRVKLCLFLLLLLLSLVSASYIDTAKDVDPTVRYRRTNRYWNRRCGRLRCWGNQVCVRRRRWNGRWYRKCENPRRYRRCGRSRCWGNQVCVRRRRWNGRWSWKCVESENRRERPSESPSVSPSASITPSISPSPSSPVRTVVQSVSETKTFKILTQPTVSSRQLTDDDTSSGETDENMITFDFAGKGLIFEGQQALVTVGGIQGDYNETESFINLNINQGTSSSISLTGIGGVEACTDTLQPPTRPSNPSVTTNIIDLGGGKLGVTVQAIAAAGVEICDNELNNIEVTVTTVSQIPGVSVSPSATASISSSMVMSATPTPSLSAESTPSISMSSAANTVSMTPTLSSTMTPIISESSIPTASTTPSASEMMTVSLSTSPTVSASLGVTPSVTPSAIASESASVTVSATPSITSPGVELPAPSPVTIARVFPISVESTVSMRQVSTGSNGTDIEGDPTVIIFDFTGKGTVFNGQQALVTVEGIKGDYNQTDSFINLKINQGTFSEISLREIGGGEACTSTLIPPTRPSNPSVTATIIDLGGGKLGVTAKAVAAGTLRTCTSGVNEIKVSVTTISQVPGTAVSASATASVSASATASVSTSIVMSGTPSPSSTEVQPEPSIHSPLKI